MTAKSDPRFERILESFAHELVIAVFNFDLHAQTSQHVQDNYRQMNSSLAKLFQLEHSPLRLEFAEHCLKVDDQALLGASLQAGRLLQKAADRGIDAVILNPHITEGELARFIELLCTELDVGAFLPPNLSNAFNALGIEHIDVLTRASSQTDSKADSKAQGETLNKTPQSANGNGDSLAESQALIDYQGIANVLQESHTAAFRGEELELDRAAGVVEQAVKHMSLEASNLLALANYDDIDSFTVGHSVRVALLALQVARAAGSSHEMMLRVGTAAMLHDIGKSRVPQEVLFKQGSLSEEEWGFMTQHPRLGAEILLEQPGIDSAAVSAAFCHHMSPGGGYPNAALPFAPSGISKLVRVCDVFEALTAIRPYKKALTPLEAYVIMHREPGDFDPQWLRFFVQTIGIFPLGSRVLLDSGAEAIVTEHGSCGHQPIVRLAHDICLPGGEPATFTIGQCHEGTTHQIAEVIAKRTEPKDVDDSDLTQATEHRCCPQSAPHD